jgi:uncharacterized membrane protein YciS (DUF1049 family)
MSQALTVEQFQRALPPQVKKSVNVELMDRVNNLLGDPELVDAYRDNLVSYTSVMAQGKYKISNYVDAVRYVTHKLLGKTNIDAYTCTFPEKYQRFISQGVVPKDIASYCTAYHKSKLVQGIFAQTLTPSWIMNADLYQKALNVQADLMMNANSEKVRTEAANSILNQLKMPETQKVELDIGIRENSAINELRKSTMELVAQQKLMLQSGAMNAQEIAHSKLAIEAEFEDVTD